MPCGFPLPCKRHTCTKPCHPPPCNTGPCNLPCNLAKSGCGHACSKPCHDGPCPQKICKIMVILKLHQSIYCIIRLPNDINVNVLYSFQVSVSCICGNLKEARMCSDSKVIEYRLQVKSQSLSLLDNIVESSPAIKSYKM